MDFDGFLLPYEIEREIRRLMDYVLFVLQRCSESLDGRRPFVSKNLLKAQGKSAKKQRRCIKSSIGETSATSTSPKQSEETKTKEMKEIKSEPKKKDLKEIIEDKSVPEGLKIIKDRLNRCLKEDKIAEMKSMADMKSLLMSNQNQIQWPLLSNLQDIMKKINEIESDYKKAADLNTGITKMGVTDDEFKQRLVEAKEALENLNEQLRKDSIKTMNLEAVFTNSEGFSEKALKRELYLEFPWILSEETATNNGCATGVKDQGRLRDQEMLLATFSNLENELYAMDNNKVDVSDFHGLEEALEKTTWGKTPDYLEPIAIRIEKARGKATEVSHNNIQVLVCAAIHEMEDLQVEKWNWDMMKKWGATLNMAKELGFEVEFAENLLKKNLYAYFAYATNVF